MHQIEHSDILQTVEKVLFIMDLSVRDFIYFQSYLSEFTKIYPNKTVDLFINTTKRSILKPKKIQICALKNIFKEQHLLNNIYFEPEKIQNSIKNAKNANYPLIILLDKCAQPTNIKFATKLSPKAFLIGPTTHVKWYSFFKKNAYKRLNCKLEIESKKQFELSGFYSAIFSKINNKETNLKPLVQIPKKWIVYAKLKFLKWGIDKKGKEFNRVFFINLFDDDGNYAYNLKNLSKLIVKLKKNDEWGDVNFILHAPSKKFRQVKKFFAANSVNNLFLISPDYDFFQIPAILSLCDAVFTVDGVCMDLANALSVRAFEVDKLNSIENNEQII